MSSNQLRPGEAALQPITRRGFFRLAGRGAGFAAVAGGVFLTWRAWNQGVFSAGSGPAYDAWHEWAAQPESDVDIVRAAVLAANAHDTQPWLFRMRPDQIELHVDLGRNIGAIDPLRREMFISLGCALENLVQAASAAGRAPAVEMPSAGASSTLVASIRLSSGPREISSLYRAIPDRHTNRGGYDQSRTVSPSVLSSIEGLATEADVSLVWWTSATDRRRFSDVTLRAEEAIAADPLQAADDFHWWRGSWGAVQSSKDGVTIDASGLPPLLRALGKILPDQDASGYEQGFTTSLRDTQLATATTLGSIVVRDAFDQAQRVNAGRVYQRINLWATTQGLAMQPLNQAVERADRERAAGLEPVFAGELAGLMPASGVAPVMPFRLGYPTSEGLPSPRRPAEDVTINA